MLKISNPSYAIRGILPPNPLLLIIFKRIISQHVILNLIDCFFQNLWFCEKCLHFVNKTPLSFADRFTHFVCDSMVHFVKKFVHIYFIRHVKTTFLLFTSQQTWHLVTFVSAESLFKTCHRQLLNRVLLITNFSRTY